MGTTTMPAAGSPTGAPVAQPIYIVDVNGNPISSFGGGTQYTDGAAAPTHPIGTELVYNNGGTMTAVSAANPLPTSATVTPPANQRVNAQANDFLTGSIVDLATLLTLAGTPTDANTVNSLMGRLTKIRDLLNASLPLPTNASQETGGNLAQLVTNTADLLADGDNLASILTQDTTTATNTTTLAGIVSGSKAAVKAASGDFADGALATLGNKADAKSTATDTTAVSAMSVLKEISAMAQAPASTPVTGTFWQATQPVSGTVTANAGTNLNTSALALETGGNLATIATVEGATTDAAVVGDVAGSHAAKLRGLSKILNAVWDSVNGLLNTNTSRVGGTAVDTNSGNKSAGTQRVVLATDQPALTNKLLVTPDSVALPAHQSTNVDQLNGNTTDTNSGNKSAGTLRVVLATDQPSLTNAQPVNIKVASSGGSVPYHNLTAATTNFTNVKGAACQMYRLSISNTSASVIYVKIYDKATAPATTDVPKATCMINANTFAPNALPEGMKLATGMGWAATGAVADNDNTAIAANCVVDFSLDS